MSCYSSLSSSENLASHQIVQHPLRKHFNGLHYFSFLSSISIYLVLNNPPSCLPLPYYILLTPIFRFTTPHHKEGFELFLDTIVAMDDVWVVTAWQTIQWMRNPVDLENIENFPPFQCDYKVLKLFIERQTTSLFSGPTTPM